MYHPSRGGVRGGRDQFKWDDVKADKHRENYLGHSIKAPVGRWQKGKDLFWYTRDKNSGSSNSDDARKEEIRRIKEEEEQAMREALGLAPKRASRPQGNRLDKYEYAELVKRGSTAEDLGAGHAEAAQVQGLGLYKVPRNREESFSLPGNLQEAKSNTLTESQLESDEDRSEEESRRKRRREERKNEERSRDTPENVKERRRDTPENVKERRRDKHENVKERRRDKQEKHHRKDKEKRRHDSD
uniref:Multiple myeloma tumor-associated protein 2-like N-terminal domain-containing protein n=1 Tax=Ananas comosus var. bracteatus TaxID=296719 RepID=A0A6V7Q6P2_ANACO|nr:unnamed protein product [Ananas comosus var. bracteatus]